LEEKPFSPQTSFILRWLIVLLFGTSIFLFLQMKETRIDILKVGTPASKYIVAQIDFSFLDEEKNFLKRQEAVQAIGPIYKIDEKQLFDREIDLDRYLVFNPSWRASAQGYNFQDIYRAVDNVQRALFASRYTDLSTLAEIGHLPHNSFLKKFLFQFFMPPASLENDISIPSDIWDNLVNIAFAGEIYDKETLSFVVDYYKQKNWQLKEDVLLGQMLQKMAQDSIPNQYSHMQAGERIIDEGQVATTRNIAMLVAMKKKMRLYHNPWKSQIFLGTAILSAILCITWCIYLRYLHSDVFYSAKKMLLLVLILILTLGFYKGIEYFLLRNTSNILEHVRYPIIVPFAAVLLSSLVNVRIALFSCVSISIVLSLGSAMDRNGFFIANVLPAIICVMAMQGLHKRKQVLNVLAKAFFIALPIVLGLDLFKDQASMPELTYDAVATLGFMLLSAILVIGLMPVFEGLFRVMTDISLMEFMDPSNPLLKRLMIEAPGTYQHSIVVGNLSEAAAIAVGANGLFCRVSTQYHDIGKLIAPQYFTENQQAGVSMHQLLTPLESAQVI
ncbi:MAG: HDIG domain-containing metalloprotein, partial [Chlamydiota bacterium]